MDISGRDQTQHWRITSLQEGRLSHGNISPTAHTTGSLQPILFSGQRWQDLRCWYNNPPIIDLLFTYHSIVGNVIITTLPSISTKGMTTDDLEKLMEETNEKMKRVFEETSKEVMDLQISDT